MLIYFAGLARDCGSSVFSNLNHINSILCDLHDVSEVKYFLLENNSLDDTYEELLRFKEAIPSDVDIFKLDHLFNLLPSRIPRITFCREYLLREIRGVVDAKTSQEALLFWGDLDENILSSMIEFEVHRAIEFLRINREVDAVFPFSRPCYYDIFALRALNWQDCDCFDAMKKDIAGKGRYVAYIDNIASKKISYDDIDKSEPIKVRSAFGGAGLYRLSCIDKSYFDKSMTIHELNKIKELQCEHIHFNLQLSNLYILPFWTVDAPRSHTQIKLSLMSRLHFALKSFAREILWF